VAADAAAALPTIRKAWHDPDSEDVLFYVLVGTGATITLLTIRSWGPSGWAFAGYMLALRRFHDLGGRRPSAIMSRLRLREPRRRRRRFRLARTPSRRSRTRAARKPVARGCAGRPGACWAPATESTSATHGGVLRWSRCEATHGIPSLRGDVEAVVDANAEIDTRTLIARMTDAGINPEKAHKLIRDGWIRLDGEYATGPDQLAGKPHRYVIQPPGPTTEGADPNEPAASAARE
jgi:hypothetical protein